MKSFLLSAAVLAAILAGALWNASAVSTLCEDWQQQLSLADALAEEGRWEEAAETVKKSHRDWSSRQQYLHIVLKHEALDEAQVTYHRAIAFALQQESAEFHAETAALAAQLELLAQTEEFSLNNVF